MIVIMIGLTTSTSLSRNILRFCYVTHALVLTCAGAGCVSHVDPSHQTLNVESVSTESLANLVLRKRVVPLETRTKQSIYGHESEVDSLSTSRFGAAGEVAKLDCIVSGIRLAAPQSELIPTERFWAALGGDKDKIELSALLTGSEAGVLKELDTDILIVAYHQIVGLESGFMEVVIEGGISREDRITVAVAVLDLATQKLINVAKSEYENHFVALHFFVVVPAARFTEPNFAPCEFLGERAGEAINAHAVGRRSRVLVVATNDDLFEATR